MRQMVLFSPWPIVLERPSCVFWKQRISLHFINFLCVASRRIPVWLRARESGRLCGRRWIIWVVSRLWRSQQDRCFMCWLRMRRVSHVHVKRDDVWELAEADGSHSLRPAQIGPNYFLKHHRDFSHVPLLFPLTLWLCICQTTAGCLYS